MKVTRAEKRNRRRLSMKSKIRGTSDKPRLAVFRSNMNLYTQIIDDTKGVVLCSASSLDKDIAMRGHSNKGVAEKIGSLLSERAKKLNIDKVVFDRSGYLYHGVVQELANSARKGGLDF